LIVVFSVVFLALHLPYLPTSLEDLDSINFALGVRDFDVAHHQPHPPGYPVFILFGKAMHAVVSNEAAALALVSVLAATLGVLAIAALFRRLDGADADARWTSAAAALAATTPLYWFTAVRPLSDAAGLAAALAVQVMTLAASSTAGLTAAAFFAGLAAGLRSQVLWLTVPLLALRALQGLRAEGSGLKRDGRGPAALSLQPLALLALAFLAGAVLWFVPLVAFTGGPAPYWHALFDQGAEDLGNIQMLWNNHGARDVVDALYYAFVAPFAAWPVAAVVLTCAAAGLASLARRRRDAVIVLAIAFGPYLLFDLLFQETFTSRYALPLVVPLAYLAVAGLRALPWDTGLAVSVGTAMLSAHVGGRSIAEYARTPAPAFRMLDAMVTTASADRIVPVLAADRRQSFDLRRPIKWTSEAGPHFAAVLPAPPQHEWLEAVKYWNGGGRAPVWFVVDPRRESIDLVQHGDPVRFEWRLPYPVLLSGVRPNDMDWYRVDRPEWYVGEGWALTPEAAGVAEAEGRGPSHAPIVAWVSRDVTGGRLMIGGRSFDQGATPRLTIRMDGRVVRERLLAPGPFLDFMTLPPPASSADTGSVRAVSVETSPGSRVAVEQFDASATRPIVGFGAGWHEQELNPRTGARWRWLSERGELRLDAPQSALTLHLEGESPRTYFPRPSRLVIRSGAHIVFDRAMDDAFSIDVPIGAPGDSIVLETDQTYVPAERSRRTEDRRRLGLRIFKMRVIQTGLRASASSELPNGSSR